MKALVGWADFAHSPDAPRNEGCDRWSERRRRPAGPGPDDVDLQNEAVGYHSMVTKTWCGYLKLVWEPCARTRPARLGNSSTRPPSHEPCP